MLEEMIYRHISYKYGRNMGNALCLDRDIGEVTVLMHEKRPFLR